MKVLNLYAGIGGNRKLWEDVEVTAVEMNSDIASIYQDFFSDDTVIVGDAHQYLLDHYKEYDFIWSSPPCPSHSQFAKLRALSNDQRTGNAATKPQFIDMKLYQEIIFLQNYFNNNWVIENVIPYYNPLIPPTAEIGRHLFWCNFNLKSFSVETEHVIKHIHGGETVYGFNVNGRSVDKRKVLRNMVNPKVGEYILNAVRNYTPPIQTGLFAEDSK